MASEDFLFFFWWGEIQNIECQESWHLHLNFDTQSLLFFLGLDYTSHGQKCWKCPPIGRLTDSSSRILQLYLPWKWHFYKGECGSLHVRIRFSLQTNNNLTRYLFICVTILFVGKEEYLFNCKELKDVLLPMQYFGYWLSDMV